MTGGPTEIFGKKMVPIRATRWIVFNFLGKTADGMDIEFAECRHCGREVMPNMNLAKGIMRYPKNCPGCGRVTSRETYLKE